MITTKVYDEHGKLIESKRFRSFNRMTDYAAEVTGCMLKAARIVVNDGTQEGVIDCWKERDRAVANGYELPVHREMLGETA